ncbi:MAG: FecR domain-containing protein [Rhodospirillales bacterium]|nr:FecR domain-containing protein [Rhodospirillales bacterium]
MRRLSAISAFALAILATGSAAEAQTAPQQAGVAAAVRGQVLVAERAGAVGKLTKSGEPIFLGNAIKSGADSGLQVLLLDQTTFTIGPDSELVIDEFVFDPAKGSGKVTATVAKGVFRFVTGQVARENPANMLVRMPAGTIGIRGTIAIGSVIPGATPGAPPALQEVALMGPGRDRDSRDRKGALLLTGPGGNSVNLDQAGFGSSLSPDGKGWGSPVRWPPEKMAAMQALLSRAPAGGSGGGESGQASRNAGSSPVDGKAAAQLASLVSNFGTFGDSLIADQTFDQQRQTLTAGLADGKSTFEQLRTATSGQAYYSGTAGLSSGGSYSIFANIDFGNRSFGGGNSRAVFNSPSNFSGTVALGSKSYDQLSGVATFQYINTTSVTGLGCQTFACRTTVNITPLNAGGVLAGQAAHDALVQRTDSFGNPTVTLATGSGTATRTNGLAP